jgi:hypothetical protein
MKPEDYLAQLAALMAAGRHREALAFAAAESSRIAPPLTVEQRESLYGPMETAATLASLAYGAPPAPSAPRPTLLVCG